MKKSTQEIVRRTRGRGSDVDNAAGTATFSVAAQAQKGLGWNGNDALFGEAANDAVFEVRRVG